MLMKSKKYKNKRNIVEKVFNEAFTKYDLMNDIMSLKIHRFWKNNMLNWLSPQKNTKLIDVASGTGDIAKLYLEKINFNGNAFCLDQNKNMINLGKKKLKKLDKIKWFKGKAEKLPFKNNIFDYYTISFGIRNVESIDKTLKEARRVLKPGGRFLCLEFSKIENNMLNKIYKSYSKIIPKVGKVILGSASPYEYLINSIENFYSQDELLEKLKKNNFYKSEYRNLSGGIVAIHSGWKI